VGDSSHEESELQEAAVLENIGEKLKRADEHIAQLQRELRAFIKKAPASHIVNDDAEASESFRRFHERRIIDARLSVLAGDVLHQLRSSLDHLLCGLVLRDQGTVN
jgi:hypothetical protein